MLEEELSGGKLRKSKKKTIIKEMEDATPIAIINCAMAMDGGSLSLLLVDENGIQHTVLIPQFAEPITYSDSRPPGSLIFDGKVVGVRGEEEKKIVDALKNANIIAEDIVPDRFHNSPHVETSSDIKEFMSGTVRKVMEQTVKHIIDFIESDKYIELAISQKRYH
jgi:hypothetical protein